MTTETLERFNPSQADPTAPDEAFRFEAAKFDVGKFEQAGEQQENRRRGRMLAKTGDALNHWYWDRIVFDLSGMKSKDRVSIDWCHEADELVGFGENLDVSMGDLWLDVEIISLEAGDEADKLLKRSAAGIPYEASIHFDPENHLRLEYAEAGMSVEVNGREFEGPILVVREWELRRIAVCPSGYDSGTTTQLSQQGTAKGGRHSLKLEATTMTKKPATPKDPKATELSTDPKGEGDTKSELKTAEPNVDPNAEAMDRLNKFCEKFGDATGAKYFRQGLSWEQALEKHNEALQTQLAEKTKSEGELKTKLSQVDLGESETVDTGGGSGSNELKEGDGRGNFAKAFKGALKKRQSQAS